MQMKYKKYCYKFQKNITTSTTNTDKNTKKTVTNTKK